MPDAEDGAGQRGQGIGREVCRGQGYRQAAVLHAHLDGNGRGLIILHTEQLRERQPQPYDTTTLNYNWQIWNAKAFSLYTPETEEINPNTARQAVQAVLRFLCAKGLCRQEIPASGVTPEIFRESCLHNILSSSGGLLLRSRAPGDVVKPGQILADILDPCCGQFLEHLRSNCTGRVFFARKSRLIDGHEVAFRILPDAQCRGALSAEQGTEEGPAAGARA